MSELAEYVTVLEEIERRKTRRKLFTYYPDEGPLRRELYQKHLEFFKAGARYRERCAMCANRVGKCISAKTMIQHPDGTETSAGELYTAGIPFPVMAWDGEKQVETMAVEPIRKPSELCYRVWLANGQWFDCAGEHRLLTKSGWFFFSDLRPFYPALPESIEGIGQITRFEDVLHWLRKSVNSLGDCPVSHHLYGGQLLSEEESGILHAPLRADVLQRDFALFCEGGLANIYTSTRQQELALPSILGVALQNVGRIAAFQDPCVCTSAQPRHEYSQNAAQPGLESSSVIRSIHGAELYQSFALVSPFMCSNEIVAYQPIGVHDIYDFTVPDYGNYIASGVVHHNTEGMGGYETALHLTGKYPNWWDGRSFDKHVRFWAAGKTNETTRDIVQSKLFGEVLGSGPTKRVSGTGLIPGENIEEITWKAGVSNLIDTAQIRHESGGISMIGLKSYQQGRGSFEGTEQDGIWLDEEPPMDIYGECLIRTATTDGLIYLTFTPLEGISEVVLQFIMPDGQENA